MEKLKLDSSERSIGNVLTDPHFAWFHKLYKLAIGAIRQEQVQDVYASWLMAVCFLATTGDAFWKEGGERYALRSSEIPFGSNCDAREFNYYCREWLSVPGKGLPKFRFDPVFTTAFLRSEFREFQSINELTLLQCRWGLGETLGAHFLQASTQKRSLTTLVSFIRDEHAQMREVCRRVKAARLAYPESLPSMFESLYARQRVEMAVDKSLITVAINYGFAQAIAESGWKQDLNSPGGTE
jgi:hypothetical protein